MSISATVNPPIQTPYDRAMNAVAGVATTLTTWLGAATTKHSPKLNLLQFKPPKPEELQKSLDSKIKALKAADSFCTMRQGLIASLKVCLDDVKNSKKLSDNSVKKELLDLVQTLSKLNQLFHLSFELYPRLIDRQPNDTGSSFTNAKEIEDEFHRISEKSQKIIAEESEALSSLIQKSKVDQKDILPKTPSKRSAQDATTEMAKFLAKHPMVALGGGYSAGMYLTNHTKLASFAPALAVGTVWSGVKKDHAAKVLDDGANLTKSLVNDVASSAFPAAVVAAITAHCAGNSDWVRPLLQTGAIVNGAWIAFNRKADAQKWIGTTFQSSANRILATTKEWFKEGYKTGLAPATLASALSFASGQSFSTNAAWFSGVYATHLSASALIHISEAEL